MNSNHLGFKIKLKKVLFFICIYGIPRTLVKILGRNRQSKLSVVGFRRTQTISIIGAGQFAFSTICYFLYRKIGIKFLDVYDLDRKNSESLSNFYKFKGVADDISNLLENDSLNTLYIASNHASHTIYAVNAMQHGIENIYIEKPISVSKTQFEEFLNVKKNYHGNIYAGYNRPFSAAIRILRKAILREVEINPNSAFSINYFILGHKIPSNHWYRDVNEGTRICGNMGHWLDLSVHLLSLRGLPGYFRININYSSIKEPDDNIVVSISSEMGDIISIMLSSRSEPFEGINENINLQFGELNSKINDFRSMELWEKNKFQRIKFFPKDVGHKSSIMQPFSSFRRNWDEIEIGTYLMLDIADMVTKNVTDFCFKVPQKIDK